MQLSLAARAGGGGRLFPGSWLSAARAQLLAVLRSIAVHSGDLIYHVSSSVGPLTMTTSLLASRTCAAALRLTTMPAAAAAAAEEARGTADGRRTKSLFARQSEEQTQKRRSPLRSKFAARSAEISSAATPTSPESSSSPVKEPLARRAAPLSCCQVTGADGRRPGSKETTCRTEL